MTPRDDICLGQPLKDHEHLDHETVGLVLQICPLSSTFHPQNVFCSVGCVKVQRVTT
ncbi:unnamed protein product, partial [Cylindrotheca closterium]